MAFLKKILAKDLAITACTPKAFSTPGACSLEEPQPKFSPPTTKSPGFTFFAKSGSKDFSKALDTIKEQATTITNNLNSYDWVGTEGTVLRYLRRVKTTQQADGNLDIESECMKALVYPAESGDGVYEEYFYWGEKLFFAYIWYDETSEYYYYNDGELIRWIDSNGKCHDNEKDNEEFVKRGEKYWNNSLKALKGEGTKTDNGNVSD